MQKILFLYLLCFFYCALNAQNTFVDKIKIPKSTFGTTVYPALNRDFFTVLTNHDSGLFVTRINNKGKILWQNIYNSEGAYPAPVVFTTSENGLLIFCSLYRDDPYVATPDLIKCDSAGNIIWSKRLTIANDKAFLHPSFIKTDSKGFYDLVFDIAYSSNNQTDHIGIAKFDTSGNLIKQSYLKNIYSSSYQGFGITSFSETNDEGYILGLRYANAFTEAQSTGYILRLDKNVNVLFYKKLYANSSDLDDGDNPLLITEKDNEYNILGYFSDYIGNSIRKNYYYLLHVIKFNHFVNAKLIPANSFALQRFMRENNSTFTVNTNNIVNSKSITALDYGSSGKFYDTLLLRKYDSLGRICPDYALPAYAYDTTFKKFIIGKNIEGVQKAFDSLYVTNDSVQSKNINILQQICAGDTPSLLKNNKESRAIASSTSSTLFPNPAHNTIIISIPLIQNQQLQLYNAEGKLLQSVQVNNHQITLNIFGYKNGFYIIKISGNDQTQILKFIKQ